MSFSESERLISREELVATMFMLADVVNDVHEIRRLLEENGEEEEEQEGET